MSFRLAGKVAAAAVLMGATSVYTGVAMAETTNQDDTKNYLGLLVHYAQPDETRDADFGQGGRILFGMPVSQRVALELGVSAINIKRESDADKDDFYYSANADFVLATAEYSFSRNRFTPIFLLGLGAYHDDVKGARHTGPYVNAGLGLLIPLSEKRTRLRLEGRVAHFFADDAPSTNDAAVSETEFTELWLGAGLQFNFGIDDRRVIEKTKVVEKTKYINKVYDLDADDDGVQNSLDKCPGTPRNTPVNAQGCPLDSDGDGVLDINDECPNTRRGAVVDTVGCEKDSDGDGVFDRDDQCPGTPRGVVVDRRGCPADSDGDGVINFVDQCPSTLKGLKVNKVGCVEKPQTLTLHGVNFEFDSAQLTLNSSTVLDQVARSLKLQPKMAVQIAGHTDNIGSFGYNLQLSHSRAASVKAYLINKGVAAWRLRSRGYGFTEPVATNATDAGRAKNRRVEFRVLNH